MYYQEYLEKGQIILQRFHELTYEAYFVGGMVRDYLLKNDYKDIDIATSATPEEIQRFFPNANMSYANDGFVTIKDGEYVFEISTFRREEYAAVSRRPSIKYYSTNLADDIDRRDFSINAIAMTDKLKVIDLCNGVKDLKRRKIRVLGKAKKRFKEDPLRILRAFELMARFGYRLTFNTRNGIEATSKAVAEISESKVHEEMLKIFFEKYGRKAIKLMVRLGIHQELLAYKDGLTIIAKNYNKLLGEEKLAICYFKYGRIPENTSFDRVMSLKIKTIIKALKEIGDKEITRLHIFQYGTEVIISADKIRCLMNKELHSSERMIEKIGHSMPINSANEMVFKGNDLVSLAGGETGPFISETMEALRQKVILGEIKNSFEDLKKEATKILIEKNILMVSGKKNSSKNKNIVLPTKDDLEEVELSEEELQKLKDQYDIEFQKLYDINLSNLLEENMNEEEIEATKEELEESIKKMLIRKNSKYVILEKGGII